MIYLTGYNYLHNHHQKIYVGPPPEAAVVKIKAESKVVVRGSSWCDRWKRRGWVSWMACRQLAATAWGQTHPVHGGASFLQVEGFRPKVGLRGGWGIGNGLGLGTMGAKGIRWCGGPMGASTPHMGRARGLGTTWLMWKAMALARGSVVLLTHLHPPPGPSPKCGLGEGGVKCWQVCSRRWSREACGSWPATQQYSNSYLTWDLPHFSCLYVNQISNIFCEHSHIKILKQQICIWTWILLKSLLCPNITEHGQNTQTRVKDKNNVMVLTWGPERAREFTILWRPP